MDVQYKQRTVQVFLFADKQHRNFNIRNFSSPVFSAIVLLPPETRYVSCCITEFGHRSHQQSSQHNATTERVDGWPLSEWITMQAQSSIHKTLPSQIRPAVGRSNKLAWKRCNLQLYTAPAIYSRLHCLQSCLCTVHDSINTTLLVCYKVLQLNITAAYSAAIYYRLQPLYAFYLPGKISTSADQMAIRHAR